MAEKAYVTMRIISRKKAGRGFTTVESTVEALLNASATPVDMGRLFEVERALNDLTGLRVHIGVENREEE